MCHRLVIEGPDKQLRHWDCKSREEAFTCLWIFLGSWPVEDTPRIVYHDTTREGTSVVLSSRAHSAMGEIG